MRCRFTLSVALLFTASCLAASVANAATLNVVGGQLLGASGVDVGGTLYNVEFLDGACIALLDGCDATTDFAFTTATDAIFASFALLDQVFLDTPDGLFDSIPALTVGCEAPDRCDVYTRFGLQTLDGTLHVAAWIAFNNTPPGTDQITIGTTLVPVTDEFSLRAGDTWAVWSPIPEPSTALLMALGLLGLAARKETRSPVQQ